MRWLAGLVRHRPARLVGPAAGVALAVALLAATATFVVAAKASMTSRAAAASVVDWQVVLAPGAEPGAATSTVASGQEVRATEAVSFAHVPGLEAKVGGSTQTTGPGVVVGMDSTYAATFPGTVRLLVGQADGVLLAQQTAANLHAAPGDTITIGRDGQPPFPVTVDGVIDLPHADTLFQNVDGRNGPTATAPPDNVVVVPSALWHEGFDTMASAHPDLVSNEIHVGLARRLPADPSSAYSHVVAMAHNLEARLAGSATVTDDLATVLGAARSDAGFAQAMFLFLATPGAVVAGVLTFAVAGAAAERRRREQALLRARGASTGALLRLAGIEAAAVGVVGSAAGVALAWSTTPAIAGTSAAGVHRGGTLVAWGLAVAAGLVIAAGAVLVPAWRDARHLSVARARQLRPHGGASRLRIGVDVALVAVAVWVFTVTNRSGYQLVTAPEGAPSISVSYWAFAGPALAWLAAGSITYRLASGAVRRGRPIIEPALRPLAGGLAGVVVVAMRRRARSVAAITTLLAVTVAFAISTATFNATYRHQVDVDALLTNGADVTVTTAPGTGITIAALQAVRSTPGVRHAEPMQHRYAYVGSDLQDLFGIQPATLPSATPLLDPFFAGGTAHDVLQRLAAQPDAILVSAETVTDYQLQPGDTVTLRIQDTTSQYRAVPFHYAGIVKEFPTAPRDSFLVANADYLARITGSDAAGTVLVDTAASDVEPVATRIRALLGPGPSVTDLHAARHEAASSLAAVDLAGLSRIELGYAVALAVAASGLMLWLDFVERRRTFVIGRALGARSRQLAAFAWADTLVVLGLAGVLGTATGFVLTRMLVAALTDVFDPPPSGLAIPWAYLGLVAGAVAAAAAGATIAVIAAGKRHTVTSLREP